MLRRSRSRTSAPIVGRPYGVWQSAAFVDATGKPVRTLLPGERCVVRLKLARNLSHLPTAPEAMVLVTTVRGREFIGATEAENPRLRRKTWRERRGTRSIVEAYKREARKLDLQAAEQVAAQKDSPPA